MKDTTVARLDELEAFYRGDTAHVEGYRQHDNPFTETDPRLARAWDLGFRGMPAASLWENQ